MEPIKLISIYNHSIATPFGPLLSPAFSFLRVKIISSRRLRPGIGLQ